MVLSRREIWLLVGVETVFFAALAAWVLWRLDRLFEPIGIIGTIAIIAFGDVVTVLVMQRFAPTEITLNPGEAANAHGQVMSGFDNGSTGVVLVRGERWRARCEG